MINFNEYMMRPIIKSDREDILFLINLFRLIKEKQDKVVYLDFKNTSFFASELYGFYHYMVDKLKAEGIDVIAKNVSEDVDRVNHLSEKYLLMNNLPSHSSIILPQNFCKDLENNNFDCFDNYMQKELLPKFISNDTVRNVITQYLSELFVNSRTHGKTNDILCGGQKYNQKNKIRIVVVDFGVTIPYNTENHYIKGRNFYFHNNDGEAIRWATDMGTSTKDSLGGLGLNSIKEFIDTYSGKLLIISRYGSYERSRCRDKIFNSLNKFCGTFVVIELDLSELNKIEKPKNSKEVLSI